jgi:hypothetical protein
MDLLIQFATIVVLSFFVACLEMTFQYFMQPNMILFPYSVLLAKIASKGEVWRHLMRPLGRCRYCNAIWITFYSYKYLLHLDILVLLAFGVTTLFITVLSKYVFADIDSASPADKLIGADYTIYDENAEKVVTINTPYQAMLYSYVILGAFYAIVYFVVPNISQTINLISLR